MHLNINFAAYLQQDSLSLVFKREESPGNTERHTS